MGKRVLVFGASGNVGSHFVKQAVEAGYKVTAFVRNPDKFTPSDKSNVEVIKGDVINRVSVEKAVGNCDIVVSCLGNPPKKKVYIMDKSYEIILSAAAKQSNPPRCLMISTIGVNGSSPLIRFMLRLIVGKEGFTDYENADQRVLDEKDVPCVSIRPSGLTDKMGLGRYHVIDKSRVVFPKFITRSDVAKFFVDCLSDTSYDGKAVMIEGVK